MRHALAVIVLACAAHAQEDPRVAARAAFAAGETAFAETDYVLALGRFREAFELQHHDGVRFNIAVCLERLGRFREAALEYDLAARSDAVEPGVRERARQMAQRARSRLGTLAIDGEIGARAA